MRRQRFAWVHWALGLAQKLSVLASGVTAAMLKANIEEAYRHLGGAVAGIVQSIQGFAWAYVPAFLTLAWLFGELRRRVGDPVVWAKLHEWITEYRDHVFTEQRGVQFHRRATLFVFVEWRLAFCRWPWSGWLVPVVRSGHTTQSCKSLFRANHRSGGGEGVAGMAWENDQNVYVEHLPDVTLPTCSDDERRDYAEATGISFDLVVAKKPAARAFYAIRIEVKGAPWGVLVLDSRSTTINTRRADLRYKMFNPLLKNLLERI